mgnify:CR=1 FL=1
MYEMDPFSRFDEYRVRRINKLLEQKNVYDYNQRYLQNQNKI